MFVQPLGRSLAPPAWRLFSPDARLRAALHQHPACLGAESCLRPSSPPCAQPCLSHAGWWRGMRFSWGSSAKEPPGSPPLARVLGLASVMTCTEVLSLTRKPVLEPPVQTFCPSQDYGNKPSSCSLCPVTPHGAGLLLLFAAAGLPCGSALLPQPCGEWFQGRDCVLGVEICKLIRNFLQKHMI